MPVTIKMNECRNVETLALIDSGAGGQFIHQEYVEQLGLSTKPLKKAITARNIDGTPNRTGTINSYVNLTMEIDRKIMDTRLLVMGLGSQRIILGFPWLNEHNPDIDWKTGTFKWRTLRPLRVKRYHDQPAHSIRTIKADDNLEVRLHSDRAQIPTRGSPEAAGYDLYSAEDTIVPAHRKMTIDTQISIATPPGTYGRIAPRSGLAAKSMIATGAGVIDADYRGIVFVLLFNHSDKDLEVKKGDEVWMAMMEELLEEDEVWINTKTSNSIEFHLLHDVKKDDFLLTEQIPEEHHEFIRVFDEDEANQFPEPRVWDHKIELKEGFQPKSFKAYNLTPE